MDYTEITELPGSYLNAEQLGRFVHRYAMSTALTRGRTLEVACGAAIGLGALQSTGRAVTGLCYTPAVLDQAQSHYAGLLPLVCGNAQQLPLQTAAHDAVLCLEAIYYFPDPAVFLGEARRVLAPGGVLLVGSSNPDWPHFVPGALTNHYPTAPELATWLQAAGLQEVRLYGAFALSQLDNRQAAALQLRRLVLQSGLQRVISPAASQLKRAAYGRLEQLPSELPTDVLQEAVETLSLNLLPADRHDQVHRVIYALGHAPGD